MISKENFGPKRLFVEAKKIDGYESMEDSFSNLCHVFKPRFILTKGDVIVFTNENAIGNEMKERHFVAVIAKSDVNNGMVTVVALKSLRDRHPQSKSDVVLGQIDGISKNDERTIAVVNQISSIDKRRIIGKDFLEREFENMRVGLVSDNQIISVKTINVYRLTNDQIKKLEQGLVNFVKFGTADGYPAN